MVTGSIDAYNTSYRVSEHGEISRPDTDPSGQWLCTGAVRFNNFGREVERISFEALPRLNGQWLYKNGQQCWHLTDLDHGTPRVWMNPTHVCTFDA